MSGETRIDMHEVRVWASQLDERAKLAVPKIRKTTSRAGMNIRDAIRADFRSSEDKGIRRIPVIMQWAQKSPMNMEMDVGPIAVKGGLANIAIFGTSKGGGTHLFFEHADPEIPVWERYIAEAAGDLT